MGASKIPSILSRNNTTGDDKVHDLDLEEMILLVRLRRELWKEFTELSLINCCVNQYVRKLKPFSKNPRTFYSVLPTPDPSPHPSFHDRADGSAA